MRDAESLSAPQGQRGRVEDSLGRALVHRDLIPTDGCAPASANVDVGASPPRVMIALPTSLRAAHLQHTALQVLQPEVFAAAFDQRRPDGAAVEAARCQALFGQGHVRSGRQAAVTSARRVDSRIPRAKRL